MHGRDGTDGRPLRRQRVIHNLSQESTHLSRAHMRACVCSMVKCSIPHGAAQKCSRDSRLAGFMEINPFRSARSTRLHNHRRRRRRSVRERECERECACVMHNIIIVALRCVAATRSPIKVNAFAFQRGERRERKRPVVVLRLHAKDTGAKVFLTQAHFSPAVLRGGLHACLSLSLSASSPSRDFRVHRVHIHFRAVSPYFSCRARSGVI